LLFYFARYVDCT